MIAPEGSPGLFLWHQPMYNLYSFPEKEEKKNGQKEKKKKKL